MTDTKITKTCCIIKPDAYESRFEIQKKIEDEGFRVVRHTSARLTEAQAHRFYHHKYGQKGFEQLIEHVTSGMVYVMVLSSVNCVHRFNQFCGPENPNRAKTMPNTLRCWYGVNKIKNGLDASPTRRQAIAQEDTVFRTNRRTCIIFGAPASGKGTQCSLLEQAYNMVQVSAGDLLRERGKSNPAIMKQLEAGQLVSDDLIFSLVQSRLNESDCVTRGWLLDGFPRNEAQVRMLIDAGIQITKMIVLNVPEEVLIERVTGRRLDPKTGKTYHLTYNPPPPSVASRCVSRSDDNEPTLRRRLQTYNSSIPTVLKHFRNVLYAEDPLPDELNRVRQAKAERENAEKNKSKSSSSSPSQAEAETDSNSAAAVGSQSIWRLFHVIVEGLDCESDAEPGTTATDQLSTVKNTAIRERSTRIRGRLKANL